MTDQAKPDTSQEVAAESQDSQVEQVEAGAEEMPEVLEDFYDALLEGDSTAMAALFTEDGGLTGSQEEPTRSDLSSPAMIQQTMAAWFSFVDYTNIENIDVISEGDTVVVVSSWEGMSATHQRSSRTPFSTTVVDVFELRDGLIAQCDVFFDYNDLTGFESDVMKRVMLFYTYTANIVPFMLEHEQVIGWLRYERLTSVPDIIYGRDIGSHYQGQALKLAKQFKQP